MSNHHSIKSYSVVVANIVIIYIGGANTYIVFVKNKKKLYL